MFAAFGAYATNPELSPESDDNWTLYKSVDGIEIRYKATDCTFATTNWEQRWFLLQITNTNADSRTIEWDTHIYVGNQCKTCGNSGEYHKTFVVDGGETVEGECSLSGDRNLTIFIQFNDKPNNEVYDRFELENIMVSE